MEAKSFALVIKSYLWERIIVDDIGVNCISLEIVHAKIYFTEIFFEALLDCAALYQVTGFIGNHFRKQYTVCALSTFIYFIKVILKLFLLFYYVSYDDSINNFHVKILVY